MTETLQQAEVDALVSAISKQDAPEPQKPTAFATYDFKRPERVSKDQMRSLENLHEVFARNVGGALSGYLRSVVEVKLSSIVQLTYAEFTANLPTPTCFALIQAPPLEGQVILEINPSIIFPVVDRLLGGGRGVTSIPDRPLTDIEQKIVGKITELMLSQLKNIWSRIKEIDFTLQEIESNPQYRQIVPPNEVAVLISFEIAMGESRGMMNLCIPFTTIEPIMPSFALENIYNFMRRRTGGTEGRAIAAALSDSQIEMVVHLAETQITVSDLVRLAPGDIIQTTKPASSPLLITIEGRPKFKAKACTISNKKAVKVSAPATIHDHL